MKFTIGEVTGLRKTKKWCDGKRQFPSMEAAERNLDQMMRDPNEDPEEIATMHAYECPERLGGEKHFHIGHTKQRGPIDAEVIKRKDSQGWR